MDARPARRRDDDFGGALGYAVGLGITAVLAYVFNAIVGRSLGPSGFSTYGALLSILLAMSGPITAMLAGAAMAAVRAGRVPRAGWRRAAVTVGIAASLGAVLLPGATSRAASWFVVACAASFVLAWNRGVLIGFGRLGLVGITFVVEGVVRVGLAALFLELGWGLAGASAGLAVGISAMAVATRFLIPRAERAEPVPVGPDVVIATWGLLAVAMLQFADVVAMRLVGTGAGSYMAASSIARLALYAQAPAAAYALRRAGVAGPRAALPRALALALGPALVATACMVAAPRAILSLTYGGRYVAAAGLLRVLGVSMLLGGTALVLIHLLMGAGRTVWAWSMTLTGVVGLWLVFVGATVGPAATAAVMLVSQAGLLTVATVHTRRLLSARRDAAGAVLILNWRDLQHPQGGGSEVFVEQVAARLAAQGRRVTIFCSAHEGAVRDDTVGGVRHLRRGSWRTVYLWAVLYHFLGRFGPHEVVLDVSNGIPFFAPLYCGRPVVVLVHHVHREQWQLVFGGMTGRIGWWLESRAVPVVYQRHRFVAVSEATKAELVGLGLAPETISVIHNVGPRPDPAERARSSTPTIAYLGRLVPHKRVHLLLRAAADLRPEFPELLVRVAGQGPLDGELRSLASELGLDGAVRFEGHVSEDIKRELLATATVLALPSVKEGWGLSVMEAGAVGTPTVAFRVGGLQESVLDGTTGLLADDFADFESALRKVLGSPPLRDELGAAAREHAARFTWEQTMAAFGEVLEVRREEAPAPSMVIVPVIETA